MARLLSVHAMSAMIYSILHKLYRCLVYKSFLLADVSGMLSV